MDAGCLEHLRATFAGTDALYRRGSGEQGPCEATVPGPAPSAWVPPVGSSSSLASFSLILLSGRE